MEPPVQEEVYGERACRYSGTPARVLFEAVTAGRERWLPACLIGSEVMPTVIESMMPNWAVWSSLWPASRRDTVELAILRDEIRWTWRSPSPPDARGIAITRQRLNQKFGGDLRGYLYEDDAWEV